MRVCVLSDPDGGEAVQCLQDQLVRLEGDLPELPDLHGLPGVPGSIKRERCKAANGPARRSAGKAGDQGNAYLRRCLRFDLAEPMGQL